ncbi:MAG TPA: protein kinase [Vicinamibacterales bacterium]|nr:protein kinase [Vicinamibacterales bacterium]
MRAGDRFLHYRLVEPIGEGGMGVVWKAVDTSLGREVAIKLLPPSAAEDAERVARFEQEARLLATLNHAGIAAIYGLHAVDAGRFLAMELVPGEDLATRFARGRIGLKDAIDIARQLCDAIAVAHAAGVVHRDLKPANVMLTPEGKVKVLDFGLAKLVAAADATSSPNASLSPTLTSAGTRAGVILGTAAYMSPEQARGRTVDKRTDIWAFGCLLFEMLTSAKAFSGPTVTDILAAIIRAEPDLNRLPPGTPSAVRRLLRRCLTKEQERRLHDIADARLELDEALDELERGPSPASASLPSSRISRRELAAWALVAVLALGVTWALMVRRGETPHRTDPVQFSLDAQGLVYGLSEETDLVRDSYGVVAVSPDGSRIAFIAADADAARVWVHRFDAVDSTPLPGTEGADQLFWSADGSRIAFHRPGGVFAVSADGGPVSRVTGNLEQASEGGTWNARGDVLVGTADGVLRVDAAGGTPTPVAPIEEFGFWPAFLPDGDHFLYETEIRPGAGRGASNLGIHVRSLSDPSLRRLLLPVPSRVIYADGYLLYVSESTLMARPFDPRALEFRGEPVVLADGLDYFRSHGGATFSVGGNRLVYMRPGPSSRHRWLARDGSDLGALGEPARYARSTKISPDGTRAIGAVRSERFGTLDLVQFDLTRGTSQRVTTDENWEAEPYWSRQGDRIAYSADPNGPPDIYMLDLATGATRRLFAAPGIYETFAWAPNDEILFMEAGSGQLLSLAPSEAVEEARPKVVATLRGAREIALSPDRRLIAYAAVEDERAEIVVQPFGREGAPIRLSESGGRHPRWRGDGRELYFQNGNEVFAVSVNAARAVEAGRPRRLFQSERPFALQDVTADGQRFLVLVHTERSDAPPIQVMLDWKAFLAAHRK